MFESVRSRARIRYPIQVLQKIRTDGLWTTLETVKAKLETPISLGYCHVGRVVEADAESRFAVNDRVISNGPHAVLDLHAAHKVQRIRLLSIFQRAAKD